MSERVFNFATKQWEPEHVYRQLEDEARDALYRRATEQEEELQRTIDSLTHRELVRLHQVDWCGMNFRTYGDARRTEVLRDGLRQYCQRKRAHSTIANCPWRAMATSLERIRQLLGRTGEGCCNAR